MPQTFSGTFEGTITGGSGGGGGGWGPFCRLLLLALLILGGGTALAGPAAHAADAVGAWLSWAAWLLGVLVAAGAGVAMMVIASYWGITKIQDARNVAIYREQKRQQAIEAYRRQMIAERSAPIPMPKIAEDNRVQATRLDR